MTRQATTLSSIYEDERFAWLDRVADPVQQAAHRVFRSGSLGMRVKSWLNGTPIRHRVHPALIAVPIGAFTAALLLDTLDARSGRRRSGFGDSADACIALGLLSAIPTAASGLADWVDLSSHQRRVGMAHAIANAAALALYGASLALRSRDSARPAARALAGVGFGALSLGGALGGELVYTLGVNVPHLLYPRPPLELIDVMPSSELSERAPTVVQVEQVPVLLYRHDGQVFAVQEWCPHAGGPLSEGSFEGKIVECPWHQSRFCLSDGRPVQGPASAPLRTFDVIEEEGRIKIRASYEAMDWPSPPAPPAAYPRRVSAS